MYNILFIDEVDVSNNYSEQSWHSTYDISSPASYCYTPHFGFILSLHAHSHGLRHANKKKSQSVIPV